MDASSAPSPSWEEQLEQQRQKLQHRFQKYLAQRRKKASETLRGEEFEKYMRAATFKRFVKKQCSRILRAKKRSHLKVGVS